MNSAVRIHQQRALEAARVLEGMQAVPRELKRAQAARVFSELKAITKANPDNERAEVRRSWWLDPER